VMEQHLLATDRTVPRSSAGPAHRSRCWPDPRRPSNWPVPVPAAGRCTSTGGSVLVAAISIARRKIQVGIGHAGRAVTVDAAGTRFCVYEGGQLLATTHELSTIRSAAPIARPWSAMPWRPTCTPTPVQAWYPNSRWCLGADMRREAEPYPQPYQFGSGISSAAW
jgi:hypothetical protein